MALENAPPLLSSQRLPRNVRVLGVSSLINDIAGEMIYPLVPAFVLGVLGGGAHWLGMIEGVADTTASLVKLVSGPLSDRAGRRKPFVLAGYLLAAISRPLLALAAVPWHVVLVRTCDRFGKGIRAAPRDALVADSTDPGMRGRAFGFNRAMDHLGAAIGPAIAAMFLWKYPDRLRELFWLAAVPGVFVVLLVLFGLREPKRKSSTVARSAWAPAWTPLSRDFRWYLLALVIFTLGNSSDLFMLNRLTELGVAPEVLPIVWGAFHLVKSGGSLLAGRAVDRIGPRPLIIGGWIIYALVYLAFSAASGPWEGWGFFLIYGLFYALTEPAERTLVASLARSDQTGLAYGWFNFVIGVTVLPANILFGVLYQWYGPTIAFSTSAALALAAAVVLTSVRGTSKSD